MSRLLRSPALRACLVLVAVILAAHAVYLLQIRTNNPLLYYSGLGLPEHGTLRGSHTIDANDGWTAQALGRLAANMWSHGQVPLWNNYEGLGQPLAGEMQSAALFLPFVLLNLLPNGIFLMHLALVFVAGFATLGLLRQLRLCWVAATAGACLFALNGTFSVMTNAPFNPIAFLPMALWGVESIRSAVKEGRTPRAGVWLVAWAVALMLFSGFPETAFLQGLFVAIWAAVRWWEVPGRRRAFAGWTLLAAVAGTVLAAPILVAFKHFLGFGFTSYHAEVANVYSYPLRQIASVASPYLAGMMGNPILGVQAGWVTLSTLFLAIIGIRSDRGRLFTAALLVTLVILLLNMFGFGPAKAFLNLIPGVGAILVAKYGLILIEFIVILFAAFAIDDLIDARVGRRMPAIAAVLALAYLAAATIFVLRQDSVHSHSRSVLPVALLTAVVVLALFAVFSVRRGRFARNALSLGLIAAAIVVVDGGLTYAVPQLSTSPKASVDLAPVRFLQANLGTSRFFTLGPISPNYGSYFGIAQLNANDLPVPKKYSDFIINELRPKPGTPAAVGTKRYFGDYQLVAFNPPVSKQKRLLLAYGQAQQAYRTAGVKYVVMRRGVSSATTPADYGLIRVFQDNRFEIWQDPKADPYFSTERLCQITQQNMTGATFDCPTATDLTRLQLSSPGWTVTINGVDHSVPDAPDRLFQEIALPAGRSTVSFSYRPDHFGVAVIASLAVAVVMILDLLWSRRRRPRP